MTACLDDELKIALPDNYDFDEGDLVEVSLGLNVDEFTVTSGSRAYSEEATDAEKKIDNVWVFQFDTDGNCLIKPRYYTITNQSQLTDLPILLKADVASTIYVVANTNSDTWANATNRSKFNTITALESMDNPNNLAQEGNNLSLPMCGMITNTIVTGNENVVIPVKRTVAKLKIRVDITKDTENWEYKNINVQNIPNVNRVASRKIDNGTTPADYPSTTQWYTRSHGKKVSDDSYYDYILYVPECLHGVIEENTEDTKSDNAPQHALNIYVEIKYKSGLQDNEFTVCPGENNYNNYNIERNHVYDIHLRISHPEPGARNVSSANCIVVGTNSTAVFEPYFRKETGGGYNFKDFLDEDDPTGDKVISHMEIIWQSEGVIGDNTDGSKVYLIKEHYDADGILISTDEIKYDQSAPQPEAVKHRVKSRSGVANKTITKIVVHTGSDGNALIGGFNVKGKIIWSWHIWCTDNEPDNIGNAQFYTTFDWDEKGIYTDRIVPGYAIMPCNLGSLEITPANNLNSVRRSYGMLYQWGRKDPFPSAKTPRSYTGRYYYNSDNVLAIYDNANVKIGNDRMANLVDTTLLFSSIAASDIKKMGSWREVIDYTIHHPTHFMRGSDEVYTGNTDHNASKMTFEGEWMPYADDRLWGGEVPRTDGTMKRYYVSAAKRYLYDNYGTEKSIFDPCPKGWRVSPPDLWLRMTKTGLNISSLNNANGDIFGNNGQLCYGFNVYLTGWRTGSTSFFPTAGNRRPDGMVSKESACGNYHNATAIAVGRTNPMHIHNTAGNFAPFTTDYVYTVKSLAGSIRCVRDHK